MGNEFYEKLKDQKSCPDEYSKTVDKHFWELFDKPKCSCPCCIKLGPSEPKGLEEEEKRNIKRLAEKVEKLSMAKWKELNLPKFIKNLDENDE